MSSLGRASINIDLNKSSISAINDQNSLILKNAKDIIVIKQNLGDPSIDEVTDQNDVIVISASPATHLNLDVENLQDQVGSDDIDPKTGIFLRLFNIENGDTIIPHYEKSSVYLYIILSY